MHLPSWLNKHEARQGRTGVLDAPHAAHFNHNTPKIRGVWFEANPAFHACRGACTTVAFNVPLYSPGLSEDYSEWRLQYTRPDLHLVHATHRELPMRPCMKQGQCEQHPPCCHHCRQRVHGWPMIAHVVPRCGWCLAVVHALQALRLIRLQQHTSSRDFNAMLALTQIPTCG